MKLLHLVGAFLAAPLLASAIPTPESLPVLYANLARRTPPNIPTTAEAKALLAACTVAPPGPQTGYSRSKFKTWDTINGTCNTRETVLVRDGTGVQVDSACRATSGTWVSPYDGATWTSASNLDIDHFIPLSNAWKVCFDVMDEREGMRR